MAEWFTESPFWLVATIMGITCALVVVYSQTRLASLKPLIFAGVVLAILPIITSFLVVTDREQIQNHVYSMANCVRQNDVDGILRHVDPDSRSTFDRFAREMPMLEFSACNVTAFQNLEIDPEDPNKASAQFTVFVNLDAPSYNHTGPAVRAVEMQFKRTVDGRWLVTGFRHNPTEFMQRLLN